MLPNSKETDPKDSLWLMAQCSTTDTITLLKNDVKANKWQVAGIRILYTLQVQQNKQLQMWKCTGCVSLMLTRSPAKMGSGKHDSWLLLWAPKDTPEGITSQILLKIRHVSLGFSTNSPHMAICKQNKSLFRVPISNSALFSLSLSRAWKSHMYKQV